MSKLENNAAGFWVRIHATRQCSKATQQTKNVTSDINRRTKETSPTTWRAVSWLETATCHCMRGWGNNGLLKILRSFNKRQQLILQFTENC